MTPPDALFWRTLTHRPTIHVAESVHIDLDGAWSPTVAEDSGYLDCRSWGPRLRYSAPAREVEAFYESIRESIGRFTLFGSGDFHHLSALWLRQFTEPLTLISFDNHPDWDTRPPRWCCGTWINRALELPAVRRAAIWGCGNFELNWPGYLWVSRQALQAQRLEVWPWTERLKESGRRRWPGMTREDWQEKFLAFARGLAGEDVYITVDMDCLDREDSVTNWENGLFQVADIDWALEQIRLHANVVGGDLCGAYSRPRYARWVQRLGAWMDHPVAAPVDERESAAMNRRALEILWPTLTNVGTVAAGMFPQQSVKLRS
jgi:arginase family enzyme